jgi:cytochrome c1
MDGVAEDEEADEAEDEDQKEAASDEVDLTKDDKTKTKKVKAYTPEELAAAAARCVAGEKYYDVIAATGHRIPYGPLQRYVLLALLAKTFS